MKNCPRYKFLKGGKAEGMRPSDFDPKELRRGIKHEMEHTGNRCVAMRIAMDHLVENPRYYQILDRAGL